MNNPVWFVCPGKRAVFILKSGEGPAPNRWQAGGPQDGLTFSVLAAPKFHYWCCYFDSSSGLMYMFVFLISFLSLFLFSGLGV